MPPLVIPGIKHLLHEMHKELSVSLAAHFFGKSGSLIRGREREIKSIPSCAIVFLAMAKDLMPPTQITGHATFFLMASARLRLYASLSGELIFFRAGPFLPDAPEPEETSMASIPESESFFAI